VLRLPAAVMVITGWPFHISRRSLSAIMFSCDPMRCSGCNKATKTNEFDGAFAAMSKERAGALLVVPDSLLKAGRPHIVRAEPP
jgi:hypothetical protein